MRGLVAQIIVALGVGAIAFSFAVPKLLPSSSAWSTEQSKEFSAAMLAFQQVAIKAVKTKDPKERAKLMNDRMTMAAKVDELEKKLNGAVGRASTPSMVVWLLGVAMAFGGWYYYLLMPTKIPEKPKTLAEMGDEIPEPVNVSELDYTNAVRVAKTSKR